MNFLVTTTRASTTMEKKIATSFTNIGASITVFDARTAEYAAPAEAPSPEPSSDSSENGEVGSPSVTARLRLLQGGLDKPVVLFTI